MPVPRRKAKKPIVIIVDYKLSENSLRFLRVKRPCPAPLPTFLSSITAKIVSCTKYRSLMDSAASVDKVLSSFVAHQIQLVEWENHLQRFSCPAVTSVSICSHFASFLLDKVLTWFYLQRKLYCNRNNDTDSIYKGSYASSTKTIKETQPPR